MTGKHCQPGDIDRVVAHGPVQNAAAIASRAISEHVQALANLTVKLGANVAPGQIVLVNAKLGQEPLARAVAAACYEAGAHQVEVHVRRSLRPARPSAARARRGAGHRHPVGPPAARSSWPSCSGALIGLSGPTAPGLLDDVDPGRIGRDTDRRCRSGRKVIDAATVNWTIVPGPTAAWAKLVFPDLDEATALDRLWEQIARVCRLDEADPVAAWWARSTSWPPAPPSGSMRAELDSLHFDGPGTDLTVGLLPGVALDRRRLRDRLGAASTSPTSRPRRCSPPRTRSGPRGS